MARTSRILLVINEDSYILSHRLEMIEALVAAHFDVHLATQIVSHGKELEQLSITLHPLQTLNRGSLNPIANLKTLNELTKLYRTLKPDLVHHVGVNLILLGLLSAYRAGIKKSINVFAGLGYLFVSARFIVRLIRWSVLRTLKIVLRRGSHHLIVQNHDDWKTLKLLLAAQNLHLIRGAGVNTKAYHPQPFTAPSDETVRLILPARLLWTKGVGEAIEAMRLLKLSSVKAILHLAGGIDEANPDAISPALLKSWEEEGLAISLGHQTNMASLYPKYDIAILPSYREGLPKALLEAAACGLPLVATDVPGCREVITHGKNGLLVPSHDAPALAHALQRLITAPELRAKMGQESRRLAETLFDVELINKQFIALHQTILTTSPP